MNAPEAEASTVLESCYADIESAFQRKDQGALAAHLAPDFVVHQRDGRTLTRDEALSGFRAQMDGFEDVTWPRKVTHLVLEGDVATATVEGTFSATTKDEDGTPRRLRVAGTATDVWTKQGGRWLTTSTRSERREVTIDDVVIPEGE